MLVAAAKAGVDPVGSSTRIPGSRSIPFSSERQYMATLHGHRETAAHRRLVKGAVERVVEMCRRDAGGGRRDRADRSPRRPAAPPKNSPGEGLRVLATAKRRRRHPGDFEDEAFRARWC